MLPSAVHRAACFFHRLHNSEPAFDPLCFHGSDARAQKRNVDRFFAGLLIDLFYGSLFGFYALIYMYAGYFSGYACRVYYDDDVKVPMLLVAIADFLYNLAVYGLQFLLRGRMGLFTYLYRIIIPEVFIPFFNPDRVQSFYYINYHHMSITRKESESVWVLK